MFLNAIEYSNKVGARTFGIIGCDGGKLKDIAQ
jgi:phosphoheptose isomerase